MPANTSPIFTLVPNVGFARLAAANTARDGSGTLATVFTATTDGSLLNKITFTSAQAAAAASALRVMRIFITDTSGANPRLRGEILLPAVTASTTVIGATATFTFTDGLILRSGQLVQVSQSVYAGVQDQTDCIAEGGNY
jgi:hypothetical protein